MSSMGLIGKKCGMTRVFTENGITIPVSVVKIEYNRVVQLKNVEVDGYCAIQITCGAQKSFRVNKSLLGHFKKAKTSVGIGLWEFRVEEDILSNYSLGEEIKPSIFKVNQKIDVTGISKGKGFAGVIRRHNFRMQRATHGNSLAHRAPGSIGQNQTPGRVFKGKKMAGHMGNERVTTHNLEIIKVDDEAGLLLIKGAIPGAIGSTVIVRSAVKSNSSSAA